MATATQENAHVEKEKERPGASWKDKEEHVLPKNRLGIVFFGLVCALFLSKMDQTIVATALPTIVENLGGGSSYSWVGSAYMLSAAAFGPLYGKLSNMFGRKPVLYSCIFIFLFGSAMCGAAQSMTWLIVCRAIQGCGGGGISQLVVIIISDIVPLKDRGRYAGISGAMGGIASVTGPLVGGALAQHVSWRWCFFINLPTGGVASAIIFTFLNLNPHKKRSIREQVAEFDFIGLVCIVGGVVCLLIGFDFSQSTWADAKTIAPLVIGTVLLVAGGANEVFTKRSAILPGRLFKTRTTAVILVTGFIHAVVSYSTSYYLPLFYQVLGASATGAGVKMITFLLGISITSIAAGFIMSKTGKCRPIVRIAYVVLTLGMSLMTMLNYTSSLARQRTFPLVAALGMGCLYQVPLVALQAAMPLKDMATASSGYFFLRTVGSAVGLAIGEAIITSILPQKLASIPNFGTLGLGTSATELNDNISKVHLIPDVTLRDAVLHAWSEAISTIWKMSALISGFALVLTLFLREYSLDRKIVRDGGEANMPGELEKGVGHSPRDEGDAQTSNPLDADEPDATINSIEEPDKDKERVKAEVC